MNLIVLASRDPNDADYWSGTPPKPHRRPAPRWPHGDDHRADRAGDVATCAMEGSILPPRPRADVHCDPRSRNYAAARDSRQRTPAQRTIGGCGHRRTSDRCSLCRDLGAAHSVHDATWGQLLDYYPFYARDRLARETIAGGFELDRHALRNCDRAIYSSNWAADYVVHHCGVERGKLAVHPFGPNAEPIAAEALRERIRRRGQGACRLLFVGVDWQRKGGELAVAVARNLRERGLRG